VSPTRRVALGKANLSPGYGSLLLGCIAGWYSLGQDEDFFKGADVLLGHIRRKTPIAQPHLRHRFQIDLVGLSRSTHTLRKAKPKGGDVEFISAVKTSSPTPHVLGAMYAAANMTGSTHQESCRQIEESLIWANRRSVLGQEADENRNGAVPGDSLSTHRSKLATRDELLFHLMLCLPPEGGVFGDERNAGWNWAMDVLEFTEEDSDSLTLKQIENRYRQLLKLAHPDKGGNAKSAPKRIANLAQARKNLTS